MAMRSSALYHLLAFLALIVYVQAAVVCNTRTSCSTCTVDTACGWCVGPGVATCISGTSSGPNTPQTNCSVWQYSVSQIVSQVAGFPVNPVSVDVFLKPGETLHVPVQVTPLQSSQQKLDMVVVQDASASMGDDLVTFRGLATKLVNDVLAYKDDAYFALTTFIEKPLTPVGYPGTSNYVYQGWSNLSVNYNDFKNSVGAVVIHGNRDWCESSLDGMGYAIMDPWVGWRPDSKKVIVMATDACFHQQGDLAALNPWNNVTCNPPYATCCLDQPPAIDGNGYTKYPGGICPFVLPNNNMDMTLDVYDTSNPELKWPGSGEEYMSQQQWKSLMVKNNIVPIFAVTDTQASPQNEYAQWNALLDYMGVGAYYPLQSDSANLVDAIILSLDTLSRTVTMAEAQDIFNYATFSPVSYQNVDVTKVVTFDVVLNTTAAYVNQTTIQLTVFGFGIVNINVYPYLPCRGCDGVANSNQYIDACGVCAGNNACVDCAGTPFGSKVKDVCGVCGGDSTSCRGCDGVPNSGAVYDQCGVCQGNNACVGCDGKPGNPPKVKDQCNVCGGNDSCLDCNNVPFGSAKYDQCHVCNGNNNCLGCDGKFSIPPLQNDTCGVCGGNDSCYDCLGTKYGTAKLDKCGVCKGNNSCQGCDGMYNPQNKTVFDACGICGGDGKSCAGCDGIPNSHLVVDICGICGGKNSCLGCDGKPNSGKVIDACGVCGGGSSCVGCDNKINSGKVFDQCGVCGGNNTCLGCDGRPYSGTTYDICGVCQGDGTTCIGCDGVINSGKITDECGQCGGNNTCVGCDEKPYSGTVYDRCGICNGNNTCLGCDGKPFGLQYDLCGVCPNTPGYVINACLGCDNVTNSGKKFDQCGVCAGNNTCVGCDKVAFSNVTLDDCGICPNYTNGSGYVPHVCYGCDGVPFSGVTLDLCGVCPNTPGYKNNTCLGCDGVINSTLHFDLCGVCPNTKGYIPNACLGCDGVPNSGKVYDQCHNCSGDGRSCLSGCDNMPYSNKTYDGCNVCGGNNSTCKPKPFYLQKKNIAIGAGTVSGVVLGVAALIGGLLLYKRLTAGKYWYIPKDLLDSSSSAVIDNPLFDPKGEGFVESPLFEN